MYKIYINDLPITLVHSNKQRNRISDADYLEHHYENNADLLAIINYAERFPMAREIVIWSENIDELRSDFFGNFKYLEAGGGVVFNQNKEILLIERHNIWELPKGKLKKQEAKDEGALREVIEETGVQQVRLVKPVQMPGFDHDCTYHNYAGNLLRILKATYWYIMETDYSGELIPQLDEGITQAKWFNIEEVPHMLRNSYRTVQDVTATAIDEFSKNVLPPQYWKEQDSTLIK